jgi:hypothetical protein
MFCVGHLVSNAHGVFFRGNLQDGGWEKQTGTEGAIEEW